MHGVIRARTRRQISEGKKQSSETQDAERVTRRRTNVYTLATHCRYQCGGHETFSVEDTRHSVWRTRDIQCGGHETFSVEDTRHSVWRTRDIQCGRQETFSVADKRHSVWRTSDIQCGRHETFSVEDTRHSVQVQNGTCSFLQKIMSF